MGAGVSISRTHFAGFDVQQVADLVSGSWLSEYRQSCVDFGIDGKMLTRLPRDQLADALRRAGVESEDHLEFLLEELDNIRSPKVDGRKMDLDSVKPLLQKSEKQSRGWDEDSDTSDWSGVVFDESDRIKGLFLSPGNITGELPRSLGKMAFLEQLHVASNDLCGCIPETVGDLNRLTSLRLSHNRLSGRIPASLTRLASLTALDLARNAIGGTIPTKMGTMTTLRKLSLGCNKLNGSIPKEMGSMRSLLELRVRENKLAGKIPPLLGNMRSLQTLDLTCNVLQGHIPDSMGDMTDLRELWPSGNQLVGGIPETFSKLKALQSLDLSSNKVGAALTWRVFSALSSSLIYLNLSRNTFSGEIPLVPLLPIVGRAMSTGAADIVVGGAARSLNAERPPSCPLSHLNLSRNQFTGCIPSGVEAFTSLDTLDLSHNKLEGPLPRGIGSCLSLRVLSLSRCGLSGTLCEPPVPGEQEEKQEEEVGCSRQGQPDGGSLGRLLSLESLRLDHNMFEGRIPAVIGNLTRLEVLHLEANCFSGYLPTTLGMLARLWALGLHDNELIGKVPESFRRLSGLRSLRLHGNSSLRGPIPMNLASRQECVASADECVLEDTEAGMLGSRLDTWFLVPRNVFLNLPELSGFASVRPSLINCVSTVVPYDCYVFVDAKNRRRVVRRHEIAFFSHSWDLPSQQCPPPPSALERPYTDMTKLLHMKACLADAPKSIEYVWLDMLCVPMANSKRRRAAGRSVPFFVQNSARFYMLAPDNHGLQRLRSRAWCRLEALCAVCPHQRSQARSAFSPGPAHDSWESRFVYDAVGIFASTWNSSVRSEAQIRGTGDLTRAGFLEDAVKGKLSDEGDRKDVAEATFKVTNIMEVSGLVNTGVAKRVRFSCRKVLFGDQGWEGDRDDEMEMRSLPSDTTRGSDAGIFRRKVARSTALVPSGSSSAKTSGKFPT